MSDQPGRYLGLYYWPYSEEEEEEEETPTFEFCSNYSWNVTDIPPSVLASYFLHHGVPVSSEACSAVETAAVSSEESCRAGGASPPKDGRSERCSSSSARRPPMMPPPVATGHATAEQRRPPLPLVNYNVPPNTPVGPSLPAGKLYWVAAQRKHQLKKRRTL